MVAVILLTLILLQIAHQGIQKHRFGIRTSILHTNLVSWLITITYYYALIDPLFLYISLDWRDWANHEKHTMCTGWSRHWCGCQKLHFSWGDQFRCYTTLLEDACWRYPKILLAVQHLSSPGYHQVVDNHLWSFICPRLDCDVWKQAYKRNKEIYTVIQSEREK